MVSPHSSLQLLPGILWRFTARGVPRKSIGNTVRIPRRQKLSSYRSHEIRARQDKL
jgi:hypothetical protein